MRPVGRSTQVGTESRRSSRRFRARVKGLMEGPETGRG